MDAAVSAIPDGVPGLERIAGWPEVLKVALRHLAELRESFASEPAVRFVERVRTLTLVEATAAARYLGRFRVANLRRFFRRLAASLDAGTGEPQTVLRLLRRAVREEREEEEARPTAALEDAVRVLTIHRAKGLDFKHVYLLQTHKGSRRDTPPRDAAWEGADGWELRLLGAPTPGWRALQQQRRTVAEMELVRTLYVAMTRAKRRLVVAGNWPVPGTNARPGVTWRCWPRPGRCPIPARTARRHAAGPLRVARPPRGLAPSPARAVPVPSAELVARARLDVEALVAARRRRRSEWRGRSVARPPPRRTRALEQVLADRQREEDEEGRRGPPGAPGGRHATLVGAAVHWALETLPLDRPTEAALRDRDGALEAWVRWHAPAQLRDGGPGRGAQRAGALRHLTAGREVGRGRRARGGARGCPACSSGRERGGRLPVGPDRPPVPRPR